MADWRQAGTGATGAAGRELAALTREERELEASLRELDARLSAVASLRQRRERRVGHPATAATATSRADTSPAAEKPPLSSRPADADGHRGRPILAQPLQGFGPVPAAYPTPSTTGQPAQAAPQSSCASVSGPDVGALARQRADAIAAQQHAASHATAITQQSQPMLRQPPPVPPFGLGTPLQVPAAPHAGAAQWPAGPPMDHYCPGHGAGALGAHLSYPSGYLYQPQLAPGLGAPHHAASFAQQAPAAGAYVAGREPPRQHWAGYGAHPSSVAFGYLGAAGASYAPSALGTALPSCTSPHYSVMQHAPVLPASAGGQNDDAWMQAAHRAQPAFPPRAGPGAAPPAAPYRWDGGGGRGPPGAVLMPAGAAGAAPAHHPHQYLGPGLAPLGLASQRQWQQCHNQPHR